MKKIFFITAAVFITVYISAQVPEKMSYQAIIRDTNDSLVRNHWIGLQISIIQGTVNGNIVYKERFNPLPQTNINGLITVEIGTGIREKGTFSNIDWSHGPYFIKTEIDPNPSGHSNYSIISTNQILSVPYALHSKTADAIVRDGGTKIYTDDLLDRISAIERFLKLVSDSTFIDLRDNTKYKTIKIGAQTWMAENLKYLPEVSGIPVKLSQDKPQYYVLEYDGIDVTEAKATENYNLYGVLYNWPAAMNGAPESKSNPSGVQGVCPAGWHLPSMNEWKQLVDYLGGEDVAAKKLMASGSNQWTSNTGTNESGFTALPGGTLINAWGLGFVHDVALWWTSTLWYLAYESGNPKSYSYPAIDGYNSTFSFGGIFDWDDQYGTGMSVRCVKD